jgi:hypothetical protein
MDDNISKSVRRKGPGEVRSRKYLPALGLPEKANARAVMINPAIIFIAD